MKESLLVAAALAMAGSAAHAGECPVAPEHLQQIEARLGERRDDVEALKALATYVCQSALGCNAVQSLTASPGADGAEASAVCAADAARGTVRVTTTEGRIAMQFHVSVPLPTAKVRE